VIRRKWFSKKPRPEEKARTQWKQLALFGLRLRRVPERLPAGVSSFGFQVSGFFRSNN
jgi:hypothetical protein